MARLSSAALEHCWLAAKFTGVSLIGFAIDATLLQLALRAGAEPAWARVFSLVSAMQVTFVINGLHVFRTLDWASWSSCWWRYMLSNGFGNLCNYWIFLSMVSTRWSVVSLPMVALSAGSLAAWTINYLCARFFVFGRAAAAVGRFRDAAAPGGR